jgi:PrtD family type I secretion system ABC transporter
MIFSEEDPLDQAIKTSKRAIFYLVFFGFVVSFLTIATSIYSLEVFDRVLSSGSLATLGVLTLIVVIFSIILHFIQTIRMAILNDIADFLDKKLSSFLIDISFDSLKSDLSKAPPSYNIKDLSSIKNFISGHNFITAIDAPWSLIYIAIIFLIHPILGWIVVFGAVLLVLMAFANNFLTRKIADKSGQAAMILTKNLEAIERNVEVIEAMRMKKDLIKKWQDENGKLKKLQHQAHHRSNAITNITKFLRSMIYTSTIAVGAILVIDNKMSAGGIIACSILSSRALIPFDAAIGLWNGFLSAKKSYFRLKTLIKENPLAKDNIKLPQVKGDINIEKLAFILPKSQKPIINGINININAGDIVAIIGPTASGKSTLAKLMVGIYNPTSGAIRLDGADIRNCNNDDLAKYIGYLPQDIELFSGTVKSNIARMQQKFDDNKVIEAAQIACAHQMILKLPKCYETDIGAWGTKISAGQRQRIALARAFYGNPRLVILDEPNSNLDTQGDSALASCLTNAKQRGITTIIISHRQQIIKNVDKILVLVGGEAKIFGDKKEVMKKLQIPEQIN